MDDLTPITLLETNLPEIDDVTKRMLADAFRDAGLTEIFYTPDNKRMTNSQALAHMIWQATVEGEIYFADGTVMKVNENPKVWLDLVRFLSNHIDGPAGNTANFNGINVFKVYKGIDPDLV